MDAQCMAINVHRMLTELAFFATVTLIQCDFNQPIMRASTDVSATFVLDLDMEVVGVAL